MSSTFPLNVGSRSLARDPADIYEAEESKTCKGCTHDSRIAIGYGFIPICAIDRKHGKRCNRYVERSA